MAWLVRPINSALGKQNHEEELEIIHGSLKSAWVMWEPASKT